MGRRENKHIATRVRWVRVEEEKRQGRIVTLPRDTVEGQYGLIEYGKGKGRRRIRFARSCLSAAYIGHAKVGDEVHFAVEKVVTKTKEEVPMTAVQVDANQRYRPKAQKTQKTQNEGAAKWAKKQTVTKGASTSEQTENVEQENVEDKQEDHVQQQHQQKTEAAVV